MGFEGFDFGAEMTGFMVIFYVIYMLFVFGLAMLQYVLMSLGTYTIAKRRGIHKPWLAWIPIGESWILGSISDQYQYVVKGRVKNKRKSLLVLQIVLSAILVAFFVAYIGVIVNTFFNLGPDADVMEAESGLISSILWLLVLSLFMTGVSIATAVIQYMALYDLLRSCEPGNAMLYLVLSILFGITQPVFVFLCRKKDGGMPPRREEPTNTIPEPQEPWEN